MTALDPRRVALQGLGGSVRLVALQGLAPQSARPMVFQGPAKRPRKRRRDTDEDVLLFLLR